MKSFKQHLNEVLNTPYSYTRVKKYQNPKADKAYASYFEPDDGSEVDVIFTGKEHMDDTDHLDWEIEFERNGAQDITGEGDALRIIATVMKIVKDFIKIEDPKYMNLMAAKPKGSDKKLSGRERLYSRLIQKEIGSKYKVRVGNNSSGTVWNIEKK
jgi:hypothetical protein